MAARKKPSRRRVPVERRSKRTVQHRPAPMAKRGPKAKNGAKDAADEAPLSPAASVKEYRHSAKRKNNPPVGLTALETVQEAPRIRYAYDPHLPPELRYDGTGAADKLPELLAIARKRALTADEAATLANALRRHEPWLEWSGKRERKGFEVEPVALHIHERVSTQAILNIAKRETVARNLFADPEQEYHEAVQFYRHDVAWSNRLICGDSLQVMASLARREDLAGKVQMIYMDPPYGISFRSNFQAEIGNPNVKDKEADLTREPEMVKAYRDTWTLGIHSYLTYLRDRLVMARELLADSGSIFVQISDENLQRVRNLMDEVFRPDNFIVQFTFTKKGSQTGEFVPPINEYVLWYTRNRESALTKFRPLYVQRDAESDEDFAYCELPNGEVISCDDATKRGFSPDKYRRYGSNAMFSQKAGPNDPVILRGKAYPSGGNSWKIGIAKVPKIESAGRLHFSDNRVRYKRFAHDFAASAISNVWNNLAGAADKIYVVQTNTKVIQRCMLMTTDPGDLVLDPTCGSGTTAYVAEQWGRRWITIDTSRVAISLARQRILTATFQYYKLREIAAEDQRRNPSGTWLRNGGNAEYSFDYKKVPHITLKSIAQNAALEPIFAKHATILIEKLKSINTALKRLPKSLRDTLAAKLSRKTREEGKRSVSEADLRRWVLPPDNRAEALEADKKLKAVGKSSPWTVPLDFEGWYEWEVPFDSDPDWPDALQTALKEYRAAWCAKMDEVNACINANADQEELVDEPEKVTNIVRVSGPFSVEAVMPAEESFEEESPIGGAPGELEHFVSGHESDSPQNTEAYLDKMLRLLKADGVRFPNNKTVKFTRLDQATGEFIHAEGEWVTDDGKEHRVAVSFGPQFGPVTLKQVELAMRTTNRRGLDALVFAGFSFDGSAQVAIEEERADNARLKCHLAHIRPDVQMGNLLKETPNSQLFTVFGSPRTELTKQKGGQFVIEMDGVDIYDPVSNTILPTSAAKVAAWFVDTDYDGRTFCITQAFFPDKSAWEKLARALKGVVDEDRFAQLSGTTSLPFPAGKHQRAAVKVIDPRGNEVMAVHRLGKTGQLTYEKTE